MILQWVLFNVITCMVPTIIAAMFRLGVNSTFSWGLEVCLTYGMATHKNVGKCNHGSKDLECSGLFRCKAAQFTSFVQKRIPYREYVPDVGGRLVTKCCAC